nr:hypothetical protein [Pandoravirus massiliensis]
MKRLVRSATEATSSYELVNMSCDARVGNDGPDGDDPRHPIDSLTKDPIDGDADLGGTFDVETASRVPPRVATGLFVSIARVAFWLLVVIGAMAPVLGLFYLGFVRPRLAPVERMVPTECNITSHSLISR